MSLFTDALYNICPNAKWIIVGNEEFKNIQWMTEEIELPTKEEIDAEVARLEELSNQFTYRILRAEEYPAIGDQLDALFHAGVFPAEMAAQIQAVKDKYPKPESINV